MAQLLKSHPSETSFGVSESLAGILAASNGRLPMQKLSVQLGTLRDVTEMKVMEAELNDHRYYLERKVEQRTEQLVKRIALLEFCNTTLCDKLSQAQKEIVALRRMLAATQQNPVPIDCYGQPAPMGM